MAAMEESGMGATKQSTRMLLSSFVLVLVAIIAAASLPVSVKGLLIDDAPLTNQITIWNDLAITEFALLHIVQLEIIKAIREGRSDANLIAAIAYGSHYTIRTFHWEIQFQLDATLQSQLCPLKLSPEEDIKARELGIGSAIPVIKTRIVDGNLEYFTLRKPFPECCGPLGLYRFPPNVTSWVMGLIGGQPPYLAKNRRIYENVIPGPPPVGSPEYNSALREVATIGSSDARQRTPDQNALLDFGSGIGFSAFRIWFVIARKVLPPTTSLEDTAFVLALLAISTVHAEFRGNSDKWKFFHWRPITAIRNGDPHNPPVPGWVPSTPTFANPEYPSGTAFITAASRAVLMEFLGREDFTFDLTVTINQVRNATLIQTRVFNSFSQFVEAAGYYRILAGNHFWYGVRDGFLLGDTIGRTVFDIVKARYGCGGSTCASLIAK